MGGSNVGADETALQTCIYVVERKWRLISLKRVFFYIKLFPYFVAQNVKSKMSYSIDFFLGIVANILKQSLGFVFIWVVFQNIPEVNGWTFDQIMFVYGMQAITIGLNEFLFAGTWSIGNYVREGEMDRLLLRPVGTIFSIMAMDVTFHGIGAVLFGLAICITSIFHLGISITPILILFWIGAAICGALIYFSINMVCATFAFWITDTDSIMMLLQNVSEFSKYPVSLYGKVIRILLTYIIPFAFTSYYPSVVLLGINKSALCGTGIIVAASLSVTISVAFWRFALKHYQSAGG